LRTRTPLCGGRVQELIGTERNIELVAKKQETADAASE